MAFYQRKPDIIIRNGTVIDGTGMDYVIVNGTRGFVKVRKVSKS